MSAVARQRFCDRPVIFFNSRQYLPAYLPACLLSRNDPPPPPGDNTTYTDAYARRQKREAVQKRGRVFHSNTSCQKNRRNVSRRYDTDQKQRTGRSTLCATTVCPRTGDRPARHQKQKRRVLRSNRESASTFFNLVLSYLSVTISFRTIIPYYSPASASGPRFLLQGVMDSCCCGALLRGALKSVVPQVLL